MNRLVEGIDANTTQEKLVQDLRSISISYDNGSLARRIRFIEDQLNNERIAQDPRYLSNHV